MSRPLAAIPGLLVVLALGACKDPSPDHRLHPRDSGPVEPVDAAVLADLSARYLAVADAVATERCRCAGDVALCRRENRADWDEGGVDCLERGFALDASGSATLLACLEQARADFVACHSARDCADLDGRQPCIDAFADDGTDCFESVDDVARVAIATCSPVTADAGP